MFSGAKYRQYWELYRYVSTHTLPKKREIKAHLEFELDCEISDRTFERLKIEIKDIGIELKYHHGKGYSVEVDDSVQYEGIEDFIQIVSSIGYMAADIEEISRLKRYVRLTRSSKKGKEQLQPLVNACIRSVIVEFDHHNYFRKSQRKKIVKPYQMREHEGRWYLIGTEKDSPTDFRAYGLDRISALNITNTFFQINENIDADAYYKDLIGIWSGKNLQTGQEEPTERIVLQIDEMNWNYLEALPWHHSQEIIKRTDHHVEFAITVKATMDVERLILEWTPDVKVIAPESLKNKIKTALSKGIELYK
jgi:predicted DNA-binding transcriptional regulator YafY